jgi:hypothetical protein
LSREQRNLHLGNNEFDTAEGGDNNGIGNVCAITLGARRAVRSQDRRASRGCVPTDRREHSRGHRSARAGVGDRFVLRARGCNDQLLPDPPKREPVWGKSWMLKSPGRCARRDKRLKGETVPHITASRGPIRGRPAHGRVARGITSDRRRTAFSVNATNHCGNGGVDLCIQPAARQDCRGPWCTRDRTRRTRRRKTAKLRGSNLEYGLRHARTQLPA